MAWQPATLIARKRDRGSLTGDEMRQLIEAYVEHRVDDAQMAAFLMAGVINGFTTEEAVALTDALVASGTQVDLGALAGPTVDKHSTGGVGDVTTLIVAPILAAAGCQVAKLSGRGLGHTGGTLDKLESIPGLFVDLSPATMRQQVDAIGLAVASATADLAPADKRLYALRDVTATVSSQALIAASVMSKKIAGGAQHVLLDVKAGDGAFMPDVASAVELAQLCTSIGDARGRRTGAIVSDMSQPLGDGIGNAIEVAVAVETLRGERHGRLRQLCLVLAARAIELTGVDRSTAERRATDVLDAGDALDRFGALVAAQGGDQRVVEDPRGVLPKAPIVATWVPARTGIVQRISCRELGELAGELGAGRARAGDDVDPAVGLEIFIRVGDRVDTDTPAGRVHARDEQAAAHALVRLNELVEFASDEAAAPDLVATEIGFEAHR